jgi:hypothetical protein
MKIERGEKIKMISIEGKGKVPIMNTDSMRLALEKAGLSRQEPILTKKTELFGKVDLYTPDAMPSEWSSGCWYLVTEKSPEDQTPMVWALKSDHAYEAYERPHFISDHQLFIPEVSDYAPNDKLPRIEL